MVSLFYLRSQKIFCLGVRLIVIFFKHIENIILLRFAIHTAIKKLAVSLTNIFW